MSEQLLFLLKLCLLALLYLFFFRVLRAVWAEVQAPLTAPAVAQPPAVSKKQNRRGAKKADRQKRRNTATLVVVEPPANKGQAYPLTGELTIGRAAGCQVPVDDTFVSQVHARVFVRDGQYMIDDLGSTNGTHLNHRRVAGPTVLNRGDRIQIGGTVLELR